MTDAERISKAWQGVGDWLAESFPLGLPLLNPGASDEQIRALEQTIGHALPAGWSALWKANNGQSVPADEVGLFGGWIFLSVEEIAKEWRYWAEIRSSADNSLMYGASYTSEPLDAIEEAYSNAGWMPIAREPMEGNYVGADFNPGPAGRVGQVINFGRDEDDKYVLAPDLPALVEWLAGELASGRIYVEELDDGRLYITHDEGRLSAALIGSE